MPHRSYDHYCGVARALDHLGERWALLIVRELLAGPRRYSDLLADLPGISTDVLATRLRELEADGLLTRAQDGLRTYELTLSGAATAPILDALSDWGLGRLHERARSDALRAHWLGAPLARRLRPLCDAVAGTLQVHLNEANFSLAVSPEGIHQVDGVTPPDAVLTLGAETAAALAAGRTSLRQAVRDGDAKVEGTDPLASALLALA
jgi:DNA-binding HxlR family transcriptional regulator